MRIPLPKMMRHWREQEFSRHLSPPVARMALRLWAFAAKRPALYRFVASFGAWLLKTGGGHAGRLRRLPLAGGWTAHRDMPAPEGRTFQQLWAERSLR
jgi:L-lactate dehydrogenase complex protein LldF